MGSSVEFGVSVSEVGAEVGICKSFGCVGDSACSTQGWDLEN